MVSVIITTYGGSIKLERAVNSVLNQTYKELEIVVVDDNNENSEARKKTESIMKKFENNSRVKYIKHKVNMNGANARNTGIDNSIGEYLAFLDDDDFYLSNRIQNAIDYIIRNGCDGICCNVAFVRGEIVVKWTDYSNGTKLTSRDLLLNNNILGTGSNIFLTRELVSNLQGFDGEFSRFQDLEFMIRACKKANILFTNNCSIVKEDSDVREPIYERIKKSVTQFNNKFQKDIELLTEEDRNQFYCNTYKMLYRISLSSSNKNRNEAYKLIQNYGIKVSPLFDYVKRQLKKAIGQMVFYTFLVRLKNGNKDSKFRHLYPDLYNEIKGYMNIR